MCVGGGGGLNVSTYTYLYIHIHMSTAERVQNITNNVRLAFGSFNDKEAIPFSHPDIHNRVDQYSFLHQVDFTSNSTQFSVCYFCTVISESDNMKKTWFHTGMNLGSLFPITACLTQDISQQFLDCLLKLLLTGLLSY